MVSVEGRRGEDTNRVSIHNYLVQRDRAPNCCSEGSCKGRSGRCRRGTAVEKGQYSRGNHSVGVQNVSVACIILSQFIISVLALMQPPHDTQL